MKKIGILGGTFNPIHIGHLALAQTVCDRLELDKVIFVPSHYPPHKSRKPVLAARHRLQMVRLATAGNKKFETSDFEIKQGGKSYSIDTLVHFKGKYPAKTKFYFLIGSDMVAGLKNWRKINKLVKVTSFVVVRRKGFDKIKSPYPLRMISTLDLGLSSSFLRQNLKKGRSVKYLLPQKVYEYIRQHRLYA